MLLSYNFIFSNLLFEGSIFNKILFSSIVRVQSKLCDSPRAAEAHLPPVLQENDVK